MFRFSLSTATEALLNITREVEKAVCDSKIQSGIAVVFCPHTTAGITINENTDPDVQRDFLLGMRRAFPDLPDFRHSEGNSAAHLKSSSVGCSATVIIENGQLVLGRWQGIYFCEFDGPRSRQFFVQIISV